MSVHARTVQSPPRRPAEPAERTPAAAVETTAARAAEAPSDLHEPRYERVDIDRYAVRGDDGTIGYVEVVPPLFVCYIGHPYPKAEEVAQTYDFHDAVLAVAQHAAASQHRSAR